jgi:glycosyltransferase involved in cell wall biosynthesis
MRFVTTASLSELAQARVLADAIDRYHPGGRLTVLLSGHPALATDEPFTAITRHDLDVRELDRLAASHEREDLDQLLRPHLLHRLLHEGDDPLIYLSAAHDLLGPLDAVAEALAARPVLLSPRVGGDLPEDGREPTAKDLRVHGQLDPGFVALSPEPTNDRFLHWWAERAEQLAPYLLGTRGAGRPEQGKRQLRRVLELAPALFAEVALLDDPGLEASAWNLHERPLERSDEAVLAGGRVLRSLSLDGFRPDRPHLINERATRVTPSAQPLLAELLADYAQRLMARGWADRSRRADVGRRLADGTPFSDRLQRLYAEALADGEELGDIFLPAGTDAFLAWLTQTVVPGGSAGITRYLYRVYRDRSDLARVYPDLDGPDGTEFAAWCWVFGQVEMDIPAAFLPPRPAHIGREPSPPPPLSVEVAGYFTGTLGLGEAARLYVRALSAAGVTVHTTTIDAELPVDRRRPGQRDYGRLEFEGAQQSARAATNLICVNPEELPRFAARAGEEFFAGRHNIGVWAWETDAIPRRWDASFRYVDEIWVYSRYIAENLGRVSPVPVVPIPPPISRPDTGPEPELGLPPGFRFMFMFDFFSTVKRKNPLGVIRAFTNAFAPGEGPQLVIKTMHADHRRAEFEELEYAAAGRSDVQVIDRALSAADKNGLLASCDCYVSLHRSEGYGLPLAECMAMGKPVVATAYSGNLDFMTPGNSYLVDYEITPVGPDVEIYPAEGVWAEPDLEHAAAQMRAVWSDQEQARGRGERAARDIAEQLSPERVGAIARARLERLANAPVPRGPATTGLLAEVERRLAPDYVGNGQAGPLGARRIARRALLRLLKPFAVQEREVDRALVEAIRAIEQELAEHRRHLDGIGQRDHG